MSKWKSENHFCSWLRLCPDNKISGAKIIDGGRLPINNRATNALKRATCDLTNTYRGSGWCRGRGRRGSDGRGCSSRPRSHPLFSIDLMI
jgi:hypothetical protein